MKTDMTNSRSLGPGHLLHHDPGHWVPARVSVALSVSNTWSYPEFHGDRATCKVLTVALKRAVVKKIWVPGWPVVIDHSFYCHGSAALVSIELEIPAITSGVSNDAHDSLEGHLQCCVVLQFVEGTILNQEDKDEGYRYFIGWRIFSMCSTLGNLEFRSFYFRSRETQIYEITFPLNFSLQFLSQWQISKEKHNMNWS